MTDLFNITFPVSGVTTSIFLPPLVAFIVSFFTAPTLSFNLYGLGFSLILLSEGFIYLILSFILSLAIFMLLGAFGGLVAQELFGSEDSKSEENDTSKTT